MIEDPNPHIDQTELRTELSDLGPLQLVVIGFRSPSPPPGVFELLNMLRDQEIVRVVDSVIAFKNQEDRLSVLATAEPIGDTTDQIGILGRALFGREPDANQSSYRNAFLKVAPSHADQFGITNDQLLEVADLIPTNSKALFLLIEHLWAANLRAAAHADNGNVLANSWISLATLNEICRMPSPLLD